MVLREGTGKTDMEEEGLPPYSSLYPPGKEQTENSYKADCLWLNDSVKESMDIMEW